MTISQTTEEMLKAHAGRGVSNDPELLTRSKVRLLQNTSKKPKHGLGEAGRFVMPDENLTCTDQVRVIPAILYSIWVERTSDNNPTGREHFVLPSEAEKDGYRWLLPSGHILEKEGRLAGVFDGIDAEFDLAKTAMKTARTLNADATARVKKLGLPLCGLAYTLASQELTNDRGQNFFGPLFEFLGAVGEESGPSEAEILRASAIADIVETTLAQAKREAADFRSAPSTSLGLPRNIGPRPIAITTGRPLVIDDSIPF